MWKHALSFYLSLSPYPSLCNIGHHELWALCFIQELSSAPDADAKKGKLTENEYETTDIATSHVADVRKHEISARVQTDDCNDSAQTDSSVCTADEGSTAISNCDGGVMVVDLTSGNTELPSVSPCVSSTSAAMDTGQGATLKRAMESGGEVKRKELPAYLVERETTKSYLENTQFDTYVSHLIWLYLCNSLLMAISCQTAK